MKKGMNPIQKWNCSQCPGVLSLLLLLGYLLNPIIISGMEERSETRRQLPAVNLPPHVNTLLQTGNWEGAIDALEEIFNKSDSDENLSHYLSFCYEQLAVKAFQQKKYREAIEQLDQSLFYVKDDPELYMELGTCNFLLSQYREAEDHLQEAVRLNPNYGEAHKLLGEVYYLTNDSEKALLHWEEALRLEPDDKPLEKRLEKLKRYMEMNANLETEIDSFFSVSFDGQKNLQLSGKVLDILEDFYRELGRELNLYPNRQIKVILLTKQDFSDITELPQWAAGVYEGQIKIPIENYDIDVLKRVLCHEYVHAVIYDRMANRCPWWLNEGLAQYFADTGEIKQKKAEMASQLITTGEIPSLSKLPGKWLGNRIQAQNAYVLALSGVTFFLEKFNMFELQAVLDLLGEGKSLDNAMEESTRFTLAEFEAEWKESF